MPRKIRNEREVIVVADVRVRAVRERGTRGPDDGRAYWRAELGRRTVWSGWATRQEAQAAVVALVERGIEGMRPLVADIRTVRELLGAWVGTVVDGREDLSWRSREAIRGRAPREGEPPKRAGGAVRRIADGVGDVQLDRLTRAVLDGWVSRRLRAGDATYTVRFDVGVLRRAWAWGREIGATDDRDLSVPSIKAKPKREKRTPDLDEIRAVLHWLEATAPRWCVPFLLLQAATGARVGEVAAVRHEDLDLKAGTVRLRGKTGERVVPLRRSVLEAVAVLPRVGPYVWGVAPGTSDQILRYIHEANDSMERPRWTTHGLRRLAVDQLARRHVDVGTAAALLGHSPQVMLTAYRQVSAEDMRKGAAKARLGLDLTRPGKVISMNGDPSDDEGEP